jgi:hypothetical protein
MYQHHDTGRQLVISYRLHGAAELAVLEPPDAEANYQSAPTQRAR